MTEAKGYIPSTSELDGKGPGLEVGGPIGAAAEVLQMADVLAQTTEATAHNALASVAAGTLAAEVPTQDKQTDPNRQEINDTEKWSDSSPLKIEAPARTSDEELKKMDKGPISAAEFDETQLGQEILAEKKANECLSSATDSVRADILKDMAKDGQPVEVDADGWPVDKMQKVKLLDAMEKRQGEIEDNALKATVAEGLGPIPKDPQGERTWRENYKKGVDAALKGKKEYLDKNSAKTADAAGTAGAAPATGETAPSAAANSKEVAATTPEATAEKKNNDEKLNTLGQAFKDATEYLLAPSRHAKEKPGTRSKEVIMEEVKRFDATEAGNGYLKKFIFAQISLTAILGIALESADNLNKKAQAELQRPNQTHQAAA